MYRIWADIASMDKVAMPCSFLCCLVHEFMKTLPSKGSEPKDKGALLEVGSVMALCLKGYTTSGQLPNQTEALPVSVCT